jgi:hypothetical protein
MRNGCHIDLKKNLQDKTEKLYFFVTVNKKNHQKLVRLLSEAQST